MNSNDSIKKVNSICKKVLALSDEDLRHVEEMANEQVNYTHPLKMGTAAKYNELGNHNLKVFAALKALREVITQSPSPKEAGKL